MATAGAIAAVSSSLKRLLDDRMGTPTTAVTIGPPPATPGSARQLAVFLYRVSENSFLRNQEIYGQSDYAYPPLSLELSYLLVPSGGSDEDNTMGQDVLGQAMLVMHDNAILSDATLTVSAPAGQPILDPGVQDQFEQIKITPYPISLEDLTKIWTALSMPYRLTAAYCVSVVQIESQRRRADVRRVQRRIVRALPIRAPAIDEVFNATTGPRQGTDKAIVGDIVRILGRNLKDPTMAIAIDGHAANLPPTRQTATLLEFTVPANALAGVRTIQVVQSLMLGVPAVAHPGATSNVDTITVLPQLVSAPTTGAAGSDVVVTVNPPVAATQSALLRIGDYEAVRSASQAGLTAGQVRFTVPTIDPADVGTSQLTCVRVDGVDSPLTFDTTTNTFTGPLFTVT